MRIKSPGHAVFAVMMITLGILALIKGDFAPIWQPSPKDLPAREVLVYLSALISLLCGIGLLFQRTAATASRVLLAYLLLWLVLFRVLHIFQAPTAQDSLSGFAETAAIVSGAWVLYAWLASDADKQRFAFATGDKGVRIARVLYGVASIIFGQAHFRYLKETASLVPGWLPWHMCWTFITGSAFIAAGVAVIIGVWARLAATLSVLQLGFFTLIVWVPLVLAAPKPFVVSEFLISTTVTAGVLVVADSYRGTPWLAVGKR